MYKFAPTEYLDMGNDKDKQHLKSRKRENFLFE